MIARTGAENAQFALVADNAYYDCVMNLIATARLSIDASVFIVETSPARDRFLLVDRVLRGLEAARWRGVRVRLLIGGSRTNLQIAEISLTARTVARKYGIDARWLTRLDVRGSHCKMVIADAYSLVGSHNWSPGAFSGQVQDSVLVRHQGIASHLQARFTEQWRRTGHGPVSD